MKIIDKLPENWYIILTEDNKESVMSWRNATKSHARHIIEPSKALVGGWVFNYGYYHPTAYDMTDVRDMYTEITTADFNAHILNKLPEKWCVEVTRFNVEILREWSGKLLIPYSGYVTQRKGWSSHTVMGTIIPYSLFEKLVYESWKRERSSEWGIDMTVKNMRRTENHCTLTSTRPKATSMKDIKIPQQLLADGDAAAAAPQRDFIRKHYDPFKQTMPQDRVIEFYKEQVHAGCEWKRKLEEAFPFLVEKKDWKKECKQEAYVVDWGNQASGYGPIRAYIAPELSFTESNAGIMAKKIQLMAEMHKFAELRNQGWTPSQSNLSYGWPILTAYGCAPFVGKSDSSMIYSVFGINYKTREIATEALEIFGERIKEIYNKQF